MSEINLKCSRLFDKIYHSKKKIICMQGGRGSGKTWSILQYIIIKSLEDTGKVFTIVRKTLPALKASAARDFFNILKELKLYSEAKHNKTNNWYELNNNLIEFISVDEYEKIKGRKRDILFINEANELTYDDYMQLLLRTKDKILLDYNPHEEYSYIYDYILTRKDVDFIKSTYLDNPFLEDNIVQEIERLKGLDKNYWRVYGLGERGVSEAMIYTHWQYIDNLPDGQTIYGLDFGYNNPTALVKVVIKDQDNYCEEKLYKSYLTNAQLIEELKGLNIKETIYADCAEPQRIEEIRRAGFDIKPADKEVKKGIDYLKSHKLYITKSSVNLLKEIKSYSWREKDGKLMDEPVNVYNHACFTKDTKIEIPIGEKIKRTYTGKRDIYEFMGSKVTADHPYLTQRGFVGLDCLRYDDRIVVWKNKLLMELFLGDTQTQKGVSFVAIFHLMRRNFSAIKQNACTGIYGKNIMGKYQRAFISTTSMATRLIIKYLISNLYHLKNIIKNTTKNYFRYGEKILKSLFKKPLNGQKQKKEKNLELSPAKRMRNIFQDTELKETAINAEKNILPKLRGESSATIIAKLKHCGREDVYATTATSGFFLANGVVVSNCDATRYAVYTLNSQPKIDIRII